MSLPLLASCDSMTSPDEQSFREEIEAHREQWEARPFRDYAYRLERVCFCLPGTQGPVRVEVRMGRVVRVLDTETGEPVAEHLHHLFPGVDGLFTILLDAVDRDAHEIEVEWDAGLGHPTRIRIDYDPQVADEELGFDASGVEALE